MNHATEMTIRSIFAVDDSIPEEMYENTIELLRGQTASKEPHAPPPGILRFSDAAKLLNVTTWTIYTYARKGFLDRVYGSGNDKAIGVSVESYNRFINQQSLRRCPSAEQIRIAKDKALLKASISRADHERVMRKIRRELNIATGSTRKEIYASIEHLLATRKDFSLRLVCKVAGVSPSAFCSYRVRPRTPRIAQRQKESLALSIIQMNFSGNGSRICLSEAHEFLRAHGLHIAIATVARILDSNGYNRERTETSHAACN